MAANFPLRLTEEMKEDVRLLAANRKMTMHAWIVEAIEDHMKLKAQTLADLSDSELLQEMRKRFEVSLTVKMTTDQLDDFKRHVAPPAEED